MTGRGESDRWVRQVALGVCCLLAVSLAGCDSGRPTDQPSLAPTPTTSAPVAPVAPTPGPQTNPVDPADLSHGGSLKLGIADFPGSWNPWATSTFDLSPVADILTPRLFTTDAGGALRWDSSWLSTAPVVSVGEGAAMTVAYGLVPGVAWGDGQPMTAADFITTWQTCAADPGPVCQGRGFEHVTAVTQGETAADIVVTYDIVYADWRQTFARGPLRASGIVTGEDRAARWTSPLDHTAAFTGPFRVGYADESTVMLVRNPLWWGEFATLAEVRFERLSHFDLPLAYLREDIDAFWPPEANTYAASITIDGIEQRRSPGRDSRVLLVNSGAGQLADVTLRRALLLGLDRVRLADSDLAGLRWSGATLNSPVWLATQEGYEDLTTSSANTPASMSEYSLQAAKTLLSEAGWVVGEDGVRSKNGVELEWEFLVPVDDALTENEAFGLRDQLTDLGVRLELVYVEPSIAEGRVAAGQYDLTTVTWSRTTDLAAAERLTTGHLSGYANTVVDTLYDRAVVELDSELQVTMLSTIAEMAWQDVPVIPLYTIPEILLTRPGLANFGPNELGAIRWEDVGWTI